MLFLYVSIVNSKEWYTSFQGQESQDAIPPHADPKVSLGFPDSWLFYIMHLSMVWLRTSGSGGGGYQRKTDREDSPLSRDFDIKALPQGLKFDLSAAIPCVSHTGLRKNLADRWLLNLFFSFGFKLTSDKDGSRPAMPLDEGRRVAP